MEGKITVSKDIMSLPFEEFKAYIEKTLPGVEPEKLYVDNGGVLPGKKSKKNQGEK